MDAGERIGDLTDAWRQMGGVIRGAPENRGG